MYLNSPTRRETQQQLSSSRLFKCSSRLMINNSMTGQNPTPDLFQLEESFCQLSKPKRMLSLPSLQNLSEKKYVAGLIMNATKQRIDQEVNDHLTKQSRYKFIVSLSGKTLKSRPNKHKLVKRLSVIERDMNEHAMIKGQWLQVVPTWGPPFREFCTMVEYHRQVYVLGGFGSSVYNDFYSLDFWNNKWSKQPAVIPRYGHSMTVARNEIYLIGGEQSTFMQGKLLVPDIQKYDGNQWVTLKYSGVFQSRKFHACCTHFDSLIIVGGEGGKGKLLNDTVMLDLYSLKVTTFQQQSPFKDGIKYHAMVEYKDHAYLYGGIDQNGEVGDTLYSFNQFDQWKIVETTGINPPKFVMHTMITYENFILIYGGKCEDRITDYSNVIYGLRNNQWFQVEQAGTIPSGRAGHSACISGGCMIVFGGFNLEGFQSSHLQAFEIQKYIQIDTQSLVLPEIALSPIKKEPSQKMQKCQLISKINK